LIGQKSTREYVCPAKRQVSSKRQPAEVRELEKPKEKVKENKVYLQRGNKKRD